MDVNEIEFMETDEIRYVVILVTTPTGEDGVRIGRSLVEEGLAACVNLIEGIRSIFRWKGKIEQENECQLFIKTRGGQVPEVIRRVKELHTYDVPEIIVLPIIDGNPSYLQWIDEVT